MPTGSAPPALKLLVEAGDEDANLTYLSAELVHRLLFDAAIPHEYHLVQGAAHTGRSVPRRITNVLGFFQRALRPEGPDPEAEDHLARARQSGRYAPRAPNQLDFETVDFRSPPPLKIERLELYHVRSPLPAPLHVAAQPGHGQTHNELTFVRMTTDDGVVGESAGMTLGRFHAGVGDALGPFILGRTRSTSRASAACWTPARRSASAWPGSSRRCGTSPAR